MINQGPFKTTHPVISRFSWRTLQRLRILSECSPEYNQVHPGPTGPDAVSGLTSLGILPSLSAPSTSLGSLLVLHSTLSTRVFVFALSCTPSAPIHYLYVLSFLPSGL